MDQNIRIICGLRFEAVRENFPMKHWRVRIPSGKILQAGVAGIKHESRPIMFESIERLAKCLGNDRFIREFSA